MVNTSDPAFETRAYKKRKEAIALVNLLLSFYVTRIYPSRFRPKHDEKTVILQIF